MANVFFLFFFYKLIIQFWMPVHGTACCGSGGGGQLRNTGILTNRNSVSSVKNSGMPRSFGQKVGHSIGDHKNVKTTPQRTSLME